MLVFMVAQFVADLLKCITLDCLAFKTNIGWRIFFFTVKISSPRRGEWHKGFADRYVTEETV